jgi:hypothetical protein
LVEPGSNEYSAVTHPRPELRNHGGTRSSSDAVHSTRVLPNETSTEPAANSVKSRWNENGRRSSGLRPSALDMRATLLVGFVRTGVAVYPPLDFARRALPSFFAGKVSKDMKKRLLVVPAAAAALVSAIALPNATAADTVKTSTTKDGVVAKAHLQFESDADGHRYAVVWGTCTAPEGADVEITKRGVGLYRGEDPGDQPAGHNFRGLYGEEETGDGKNVLLGNFQVRKAKTNGTDDNDVKAGVFLPRNGDIEEWVDATKLYAKVSCDYTEGGEERDAVLHRTAQLSTASKASGTIDEEWLTINDDGDATDTSSTDDSANDESASEEESSTDESSADESSTDESSTDESTDADTEADTASNSSSDDTTDDSDSTTDDETVTCTCENNESSTDA